MTTIAACVGCGRQPGRDDRFCAGCGLALNGAASDVGEISSVGARTLTSTIRESDAGAPPSMEASTTVRGRVLTVVAAALVGLIGWSVFSPPTESLDDVAITLGAVEARVSDGWAADSAGAPLIEFDREALFDDAFADSDSDVRPAPDLIETDPPPLDPGRLTGLDDQWLIASNQTHLVRIDLATGVSERFEVGGLVAGHDRNRLILVQLGTGEIRSVSPSDPEGDQRLLREGRDSRIAFLDLPGDGTVNVSTWKPPSDPNDPAEMYEAVTIDLESGETIRRSTTARWPTPWGDDIGFEPGYGTYEVDRDGRTRLLTDGFVQAAGERLVLIERCNDPETCERFWTDRESGQQVDRPIPAQDEQLYIADVFGPDDRFVRINAVSRSIYFDTATGRYLPGADYSSAEASFTIDPETLSTDGRYLMVPVREGILVQGVEDGTSGLLAVDIPGSPIAVDLVPKVTAEP